MMSFDTLSDLLFALRTTASQSNRAPSSRRRKRYSHSLSRQSSAELARFAEELEDRTLLSAIWVTSTADNMDVDGQVTLREAIEAANTDSSIDGSEAGSGADEIRFDASLAGSTIILGGTQLELTDDVTIVGLGADQLKISGNNRSRIFTIEEGVTASISDLTLTNGYADGDTDQEKDGGAIYNLGTLTLTTVTVEGCFAHDDGGGLYNLRGTLTVEDSTIRENESQFRAGGIFNQSGSLIVRSSTVSDNLTEGFGGGIYTTESDGSISLLNSTVSGNQAFADGGGIRIWSGSATIEHTTITDNLADADNNDAGSGGGLVVTEFGSAVVLNSIISGNYRMASAAEVEDDVDGMLSDDSSYNLIGIGGGLTDGVNGNIVGVTDPRLAPLADNGGPTWTHALLADSPAIDAADPASLATIDQRGAARPLVGISSLRSDIGAFEFALLDFGDAPSQYGTTISEDGARHEADDSLTLGVALDEELDGTPSTNANGDDVDRALPDDEDGLLDPATDLRLTEGATPTVRVNVHNETGSEATLYGWIDYNGDGLFDNATERASITVPDATTGVVVLDFPTVPLGTAGTTYARFRLSTDVAAANPTGYAADGEVEDYVVRISVPSTGSVNWYQKISDTEGNFTGNLADGNAFGTSVTDLGDLDGDGVADLAVGAPFDGDGGPNRGAVWVLFMNADGTVKSHQKISDSEGGFTGELTDGDWFGESVASLGDLDGDGVTDLAVGAKRDDDGGTDRGAVWVLFLNADGTVKDQQKISDTEGGFTGTLTDTNWFGQSVCSLGDLDGDGITELVVGAELDDDGGADRGAVWILFLNADGTVKSQQKISDTEGGFTGELNDEDYFGRSVTNLGDLNGDGVSDLAVGAYSDKDGGSGKGAVWILFLRVDGMVQSQQKISSTEGGFTGELVEYDYFGRSVASLGDLDGDGVADLAVGAHKADDGGADRGAVWILFLQPDGTVKAHQRISDTDGGFFGSLADGDRFGNSIANLGDLNGDGVVDLAIGAIRDDDGGSDRGAVWILGLDALYKSEFNLPSDQPNEVVIQDNGVAHDGISQVAVNGIEYLYVHANGPLTITGSSLQDTITVHSLDSASPVDIVIHGGDGEDQLTVFGTAGDETATVGPGSLNWNWIFGTVTADGVEDMTLNGNGGADAVTLNDSVGDDTFVASPTTGRMYGDGFYNRVYSFQSITANATAGGNDIGVPQQAA